MNLRRLHLCLGTIQIRNWKPIPFEYITDNPNSTVEEIFGDISTASTLRILLTRYQKSSWNLVQTCLNDLWTFGYSDLLTYYCLADKLYRQDFIMDFKIWNFFWSEDVIEFLWIMFLVIQLCMFVVILHIDDCQMYCSFNCKVS